MTAESGGSCGVRESGGGEWSLTFIVPKVQEGRDCICGHGRNDGSLGGVIP